MPLTFSLYCPKYLIHVKSREHFQNLLSIEIHLDGRFVKDVWIHCLRFGTEKTAKIFKRIFWCRFTHNENIFSQMIPFSQLYWQSFRFLHSDSWPRSFNCSNAEQIICHLSFFSDAAANPFNTWLERNSSYLNKKAFYERHKIFNILGNVKCL